MYHLDNDLVAFDLLAYFYAKVIPLVYFRPEAVKYISIFRVPI